MNIASYHTILSISALAIVVCYWYCSQNHNFIRRGYGEDTAVHTILVQARNIPALKMLK